MLTDVQIRSLKPREKTYRLFDSGGLYLEVSPHGGKWWRFKYYLYRKEKRLSLGVYPAVSLKEARTRRDASRRQLAAGIDPSAARKAQKKAQDDSVEAVAREWHDKQAPAWTTAHAEKVLGRLDRHVFPWLGTRPVAEVTAPELLAVLRRTEGLGTGNVAHRLRGCLGQVFRYAIDGAHQPPHLLRFDDGCIVSASHWFQCSLHVYGRIPLGAAAGAEVVPIRGTA